MGHENHKELLSCMSFWRTSVLPNAERQPGSMQLGLEDVAVTIGSRPQLWDLCYKRRRATWGLLVPQMLLNLSMAQPTANTWGLAHQNRTIAIASDFRVDGAKSPEILQKEGVLGLEIVAWNRKSLATFHRTLTSQCSIAFSCLGNRCDFWGLRWASQSQKKSKKIADSQDLRGHIRPETLLETGMRTTTASTGSQECLEEVVHSAPFTLICHDLASVLYRHASFFLCP